MWLQDRGKLKFFGCEILYREACRLASESPYLVDLEFLPKGLHDLERHEMQSKLQSVIDAVPTDVGYEAILMGYARCSDGVVGLTARTLPLVIPKAHDCITFFFGSRHRYQEYFDQNPGSFYHTSGWLERSNPEIQGQKGVMAKLGLDQSYEEMVEKYGKDNADFILESMGGGLKHYKQVCYLKMDVMDETSLIEESEKHASEQGWTFDLRQGDISLFRKLFNHDWNEEDFVIVKPGQSLAARNDGSVLAAEPSQ